MLEDNHFGPPSLTRVLLCVSLVCKRWSSIANGLLFKRSQVCSHSALQSYNKVLRNAHKKGMSLNQNGLYRDVMRDGNRKKVTEVVLVEGRDERRIFEILGVQWREPHQRWC